MGILPTNNADIEITAKAGAGYYTKDLTGKTYEAGNGYSVSWRMTKTAIYLGGVKEDTIAVDGDVLTGTLGKNVKISIADGATVTLDNANINASGSWNEGYYAGLTCLGDATIILKDGTANAVTGFDMQYPGIYVYSGKTLTIKSETLGTGSLTAHSNGLGAGIGGGYAMSCGNIVIKGGIIMATGSTYSAGIGGGGNKSSCGNITITGGTITAVGGSGTASDLYTSGGAGIGSGYEGSCGTITITADVTRVEAWKGPDSNCIGAGSDGGCGTVTIGGMVFWDGSSYRNGGHSYLTNDCLLYPSVVTLADTMTNANMIIKVNYNYDGVNYCLFQSNGDGTYTFQSGDGEGGGNPDRGKALVVNADGRLVFKQNYWETVEKNWGVSGYAITFNVNSNTYSEWVSGFSKINYNPSFISVEVDGQFIAMTSKVTIEDLVKEDEELWEDIIMNNDDKIYSDGDIVRRCSDGAAMLWNPFDGWEVVRTSYYYSASVSYKFEGD